MMQSQQEYTQSTDEELFILVQQGDEKAFRALYRRYDKRLFAYCLRALGGRQAAEDVFQTIALTVFDKRASFTGGNFAAWLFTITRNYCLKAQQRQRHTTDLEDVSHILHDTSDKTETDIFMREALNRAIASLPQEFREALELRYFDGHSYEEIAEILKISLALAKVRVFRAKKLLQTMLSPYLQELQ